MSTDTELWLIRHGQTEWSASGRHTGRTDVPLTPAGEAGAACLAEELKGINFSLVLTSPRRRALDTCRIAGFSERAQVDPDLAEWDYGEYEGLTTAQIRERDPGWSVWDDTHPGGERLADVAARAARIMQRAEAAPGRVALFSHGHFLRILAAAWLDLEPQAGRYFGLSTASISILGHEREARVLRLWNRTFELE